MAVDSGGERQFAAVGGDPQLLETAPEDLESGGVRLVHLGDVEAGTEHLAPGGEHHGLQVGESGERDTDTLAVFSVSTRAWVSSWISSVFSEFTGACR